MESSSSCWVANSPQTGRDSRHDPRCTQWQQRGTWSELHHLLLWLWCPWTGGTFVKNVLEIWPSHCRKCQEESCEYAVLDADMKWVGKRRLAAVYTTESWARSRKEQLIGCSQSFCQSPPHPPLTPSASPLFLPAPTRVVPALCWPLFGKTWLRSSLQTESCFPWTSFFQQVCSTFHSRFNCSVREKKRKIPKKKKMFFLICEDLPKQFVSSQLGTTAQRWRWCVSLRCKHSWDWDLLVCTPRWHMCGPDVATIPVVFTVVVSEVKKKNTLTGESLNE